MELNRFKNYDEWIKPGGTAALINLRQKSLQHSGLVKEVHYYQYKKRAIDSLPEELKERWTRYFEQVS